MKLIRCLLLLFVSVTLTFAADKNTDVEKSAEETVFRKPFTLKLHVDKENYYEEKFDKMPFVHKNDVYLFKGDEFGVVLDIRDKSIREIKYQPDLEKADLTFKFTQNVETNGTAMMVLVIRNKTKEKLELSALMTVPEKEGIYKTTILPIQSGLTNYESWPHPIVQLVLRNIRIAKESIQK